MEELELSYRGSEGCALVWEQLAGVSASAPLHVTEGMKDRPPVLSATSGSGLWVELYMSQ